MTVQDFSAITIDRPTASGVNGHRAVRVVAGDCSHCDASNAAHAGQLIGVTTGAAAAGDTATIATHGPIVEPSWNWQPGPVFVGAAGQLTQNVVGLAWVQQVGVSDEPTALFVDIQAVVKRA